MEDEQYNNPPELQQQGFSEDQQDYGDFVTDQQEDQQFLGVATGQKERESIFSFFKHILGIKDSSKVGNLNPKELGMLELSVRNNEYLAKLGYLLHNKSYHDFFMSNAEITLATSMSKRGWLPELVVSQKRFTSRSVQPTTTGQPAKTGFLGLGKKRPQPEQQPQ
jgi:hypothetical protein